MDSTSEHEDRFRIITERRIREAIESGELRARTGPDQKLDLDSDGLVPEDMRMAFRVLKNSHYRPDWMELADTIEHDIAALRYAADRHFAFLRDRLDALSRPGAYRKMREEVAALKLRHQRATEHHARMIDEINHKIHRYNATVPVPSLMRGTLMAEDEMRRFAARMPAYLNY